MKLATFFGVLLAFSATAVLAQPGDCSTCRSPTGCPGLCEQDAEGNGFCRGYCGDPNAEPCDACKGAGTVNCGFDITGTQCSLVTF